MGIKMVLGDLKASIRGVRCAHGFRIEKCIACRVKMNGASYERIFAITQNREITQVLINVVLDDVARIQGFEPAREMRSTMQP
jgi:hypothetical protein